jgi:excisionase family DNA binding protein
VVHLFVKRIVGKEAASMDEFLTPLEAKGVAKVKCLSTVYKWARTGRLKPYRAGRLLRIRRSDLEKFMAGEASPARADGNENSAPTAA